MTDLNDIFYLLSMLSDGADESNCPENLFSSDEECPYGNTAFSYIQKSITIYREEVLHQEIPDDVHNRLHQVIRRRWSAFYRRTDDNEP